MDDIKNYLEYVRGKLSIKQINNYKIVKYNKNPTDIFSLYSHDNLILNSDTLLKLLIILRSSNDNIFQKLFPKSTGNVKECIDEIINLSLILSENIIFYEFDPYCNFMTSNNSSASDVRQLVEKTTNTLNISKNHNFINKVNPYGYEKVVFTGGGAKGLIYIGTFIGLFAIGQIFYINNFAGTSVGALTAMIAGCITPFCENYHRIKNMSLKHIVQKEHEIFNQYHNAIVFITERLCNRDVGKFHKPPSNTYYGFWTIYSTIVKHNGLYDPITSGFQIWYALLCKKICTIMKNGLETLIEIKRNDGSIVDLENDIIDYDECLYEGWELSNFFTYRDYHKFTGKTLVMTGTKTKCINTVYYTHTDIQYQSLSVMTGTLASMSIPWVFKAPIINDSYNLDGGLYANYPLTHCDKKNGDKITHYNNKIFGYLLDDKNTIIDVYEIFRELWLVYNEFIDVSNICYLINSMHYVKLTELFFEIRDFTHKLLFAIDYFDFDAIINIMKQLKTTKHNFLLPNINNIDQLFFSLTVLREEEKKGKQTEFSNVVKLIMKQGNTYNILIDAIIVDLNNLSNCHIEKEPIIVQQYYQMLHSLMESLAYYELKGVFIKSNDLNNPTKYFNNIMIAMYKKLIEFDELTEIESEKLKQKNYVKIGVDIAKCMISKILTKGSGNNIDIDLEADKVKNKKSYEKILDYFFHTDMTGLLYKYMCIANDKICNDSFNRMRTIKLNTFEIGTLQFDMSNKLKSRLIYEGYSKTIKHFANILNIMELTGKERTNEEFIESIELRYRKML